MNTLTKKKQADRENSFWLDPLLLKKQGQKKALNQDINDYKTKIQDEKYINYAIDKIALELMHFLIK